MIESVMDDESFVAAIEADPDDAALKLVYADWLEDRGDPRAELVRQGGELWRTPLDLMRVRVVYRRRLELRGTCDPRWIVRSTRPSFPELRRRIELLASVLPKDHVPPFECRLNEPLALASVEGLEARIGCRLPEQYRRFVTELSDGGVGPGLGIRSLEDAIDTYRARSFPPPAALAEVCGALQICRYSWPDAHWLVLTGPAAGCIWREQVERFSPVRLLRAPDDIESYAAPDQDILAMWRSAPCEAHLELVDWLVQELDDTLCEVASSTPDLDDVYERPPAQITDLNLSGRGLTEVPGELRRMTELRVLDLSSNFIEELPEWIGELVKLERLSLSNTRLRRLPESFGNLRALSWLSFYETQLDQQLLPASIGRLSRLRSMHLSSCELVELPDHIGELSVADLDLDTNKLARIPASIGRMKLHKLRLGWNQLTELPDELEHLHELTSLELTANSFTALPGCVARLPRLERLLLHLNDELDLADACRKLQHVPTLRWLSLSSGQFTALPDEIGLLTQLESLDFWPYEHASRQSDAALEISDACRKLQHLPTLRRLSLTSNQSVALPDEIELLTQLESLDLHIGELTALPSSLARLTRLRNLVGVSYSGALRQRARELLPHLYVPAP